MWYAQCWEGVAFVYFGWNLTIPSNGNDEVKISNLQDTSKIEILIARTNRIDASKDSDLEDSCVYLDTTTTPKTFLF